MTADNQNASAQKLRLDMAHDLESLLHQQLGAHLQHSLSVSEADNCLLLSGQVSTWYEKQLAQETIRRSGWNRKIRNQITVRHDSPDRSSSEKAARIAKLAMPVPQ